MRLEGVDRQGWIDDQNFSETTPRPLDRPLIAVAQQGRRCCPLPTGSPLCQADKAGFYVTHVRLVQVPSELVKATNRVQKSFRPVVLQPFAEHISFTDVDPRGTGFPRPHQHINPGRANPSLRSTSLIYVLLATTARPVQFDFSTIRIPFRGPICQEDPNRRWRLLALITQRLLRKSNVPAVVLRTSTRSTNEDTHFPNHQPGSQRALNAVLTSVLQLDDQRNSSNMVLRIGEGRSRVTAVYAFW
jgi:hypothetical protein